MIRDATTYRDVVQLVRRAAMEDHSLTEADYTRIQEVYPSIFFAEPQERRHLLLLQLADATEIQTLEGQEGLNKRIDQRSAP